MRLQSSSPCHSSITHLCFLPPSLSLKAGLHVDDLFSDLSDGRLLIRLLEIISGEKIGHVGRGRLRINKIENVGKAIAFLQQKKVCTCVCAPLNTVACPMKATKLQLLQNKKFNCH